VSFLTDSASDEILMYYAIMKKVIDKTFNAAHIRQDKKLKSQRHTALQRRDEYKVNVAIHDCKLQI
jgi:hypothetical protein